MPQSRCTAKGPLSRSVISTKHILTYAAGKNNIAACARRVCASWPTFLIPLPELIESRDFAVVRCGALDDVIRFDYLIRRERKVKCVGSVLGEHPNLYMIGETQFLLQRLWRTFFEYPNYVTFRAYSQLAQQEKSEWHQSIQTPRNLAKSSAAIRANVPANQRVPGLFH
jgi:hypothetical protein